MEPPTISRSATGGHRAFSARCAPFVFVMGFITSFPCLAAEAPYRTLAAAREGSDRLIETLEHDGATATLDLATRESHEDDPRVQQNLTRMRARLAPRLTAIGEIKNVEFVGLDRFMSSFGRYNYRIHGAKGEMRVMFTWRRKTRGWRLNQFYID